VTSAKILGVIFSHTLSPTPHIIAFLTQCNQRLYLLSQLKYQSLSSQALNIIFQALILSKITYVFPSFAGHISSTDKNRINIFFVQLIVEALLVFCLTLILLVINLIISCSGLFSILITACTTYFLKNAPLTILGNSDLEVMTTLFAISILPPSKMPFLIDVCLPVFSAVSLYCVLYILYVLPLYYVVFMFSLFT